ncbi:MAG: NACHT domain-containing protein, partial [Nitrospirales bacterium]
MPEFSVDLSEFLELIQRFLTPIFGTSIPNWLAITLAWSLSLLLLLVAVWFFMFILRKIQVLYSEIVAPFLLSPDKKQRIVRRKQFADYVESEIRKLNRFEEWNDHRYSELEAEIEAEGAWIFQHFFPAWKRTRHGIRREKSLSTALRKSSERLILVEGMPGSGKSVALRHLAMHMARDAMNKSSELSCIPIYINLKELKRQSNQVIDRILIENFVLESLNRVNDRDIEAFLENEFREGMLNNTWLFLFDSFDEIPDILSSIESDSIIREYAEALSDFLHTMNKCRGVIASRHFRGPSMLGWPRFRVLPLSRERQIELVKRANLSKEQEASVIGHIGHVNPEIRSVARNPMFLGLLCDQIKNGGVSPKNIHTIFESYITLRLNRDAERL